MTHRLEVAMIIVLVLAIIVLGLHIALILTETWSRF